MSSDKVIFRTINSSYSLDHDGRTWERIQNLGDVDPERPLRTEGGVLWAHGFIEVGNSVAIYGPPVNPEATVRRIITSVVTEVLSGSTDSWSNWEGVEEW